MTWCLRDIRTRDGLAHGAIDQLRENTVIEVHCGLHTIAHGQSCACCCFSSPACKRGFQRAFASKHRTTCGAVQVAFTKLEFPHLPAREKREEELKLYKQKQRDACALTDSLDISERQPVFLKDKGDALFAQRNYAAAVNAYSAALEAEEAGSSLALTCRCATVLLRRTEGLRGVGLRCR